MAAITTQTGTDLIQEALHSAGFRDAGDGFWYPGAVTGSLVRIRLEKSTYMIQRRADEASPWTLLASTLVSGFDPGVFSRWAENWALRV